MSSEQSSGPQQVAAGPVSEEPPGSEQPYALYMMLLTFSVIALLALTGELTAKRPQWKDERGVLAAVPHGPAEFEEKVFAPLKPLEGLDSGMDFPTPTPPISPDMWPCKQCHEEPSAADAERRPLEIEHTNIVLEHDEENRWCLDCHDFEDRDMLRLASGKKIPFSESYKLCGQCHGPTLRDWRLGIHGKRTGFWNGPKRYLLCVHCHWPHAPHFSPLEPLPPPLRPQYLRPDDRPAPAPPAPPAPPKEG